MINELKSIKSIVSLILEIDELSRDNDNYLIKKIWLHQHPEIKNLSGIDILTLFVEHKLASPESIRRTRQLLQQHNEKFRGKLYNNRKREEETKVRNYIIEESLTNNTN